MKKNGPMECVLFIMKELNIVKPVFVGYDWGASIALKMAMKNPH